MQKDVMFVGSRVTNGIFVADTGARMEASFSVVLGKVRISGRNSKKGLI